MPHAISELPIMAPKERKQIPAKSAIRVAMGDYVIIDNTSDVRVYLETNGAGPCVAIAIRGPEKTLLTHLDDDRNHKGGSRERENLHEILTRMIDLVSDDPSEIESIALVSGNGLEIVDGKPKHRAHSDEVFKDIEARKDLTHCELLHRGSKNELLIDVKSGKALALGQQLDTAQVQNTDAKGNVNRYPDSVEVGRILDLIGDQQAHADNAAAAVPSLDAQSGGGVMASEASSDDAKDASVPELDGDQGQLDANGNQSDNNPPPDANLANDALNSMEDNLASEME